MSVALLTASACVQTSTAQSMVSVGAKYHQVHTTFTDLPYDNGDISVGIAYNTHSPDSIVQLAIEGAWDVNGITTTDFIITPQMNLLWKDGAWFGGVGILTSYIDDEITGDDWIDLYWQLVIGVKVPLYGASVDIGVHYEFESWDDVTDVDVDDLAYGAWLNLGL